MQEPVSMRRYSARSSKAAPYAAQDSKFANLHSSPSALRNTAQPRNQHKGLVYRNISPTVDRRAPLSPGHNTYRDMAKTHYPPTSTQQLFNTPSQPGASPVHRSSNSTDGRASHMASGSYSAGDDASFYPAGQRNPFHETFGSSTDRYRVVSGRPAARARSHRDDFQHISQENMPPNHVEYPDAWQIGGQSFPTERRRAPFSVGTGSLHNISRRIGSLNHGPVERGLYSIAPYPSLHSFDNQSVTGRLANETFDSYIPYLDDQRYLSYEGDPNQVSQRWLP
jgi:hypothetical protein